MVFVRWKSAQQNLCNYEHALTLPIYRSFLLRMNNYTPQMIVPVVQERGPRNNTFSVRRPLLRRLLACIIHEATNKIERQSIYWTPNPLAGPSQNLAECPFVTRSKSGVTSRPILLSTSCTRQRATFPRRLADLFRQFTQHTLTKLLPLICFHSMRIACNPSSH